MSDLIIHKDWSPTKATLRRWAFDERLLLTSQDEDQVLHRENCLPVLIELASGATCPKAAYILSCLDHYLMFRVLRGPPKDLDTVNAGATLALSSKC